MFLYITQTHTIQIIYFNFIFKFHNKIQTYILKIWRNNNYVPPKNPTENIHKIIIKVSFGLLFSLVPYRWNIREPGMSVPWWTYGPSPVYRGHAGVGVAIEGRGLTIRRTPIESGVRVNRWLLRIVSHHCTYKDISMIYFLIVKQVIYTASTLTLSLVY